MPVPTVASLCAALGEHLVPAPGFTAPETDIAAVHISELADPTGYLAGGELLLTTGLTMPTDTTEVQAYVARLVEAQVAALAFGLGPAHDRIPDALATACADADLPLLYVPPPTPFLTITRAYWRARSRSTEQLLNDAVTAHRALVDAATAADPASAILVRLCALLGGWAALIGADGEVDQVHPASYADQADALRHEVARLEVSGVHSSASFTLGDHVVAVFPLAVSDRIVGYLATGSRERLAVPQRQVVLTAAVLLSLEAVRSRSADSADDAVRRCVALLLDAGLIEAAHRLAAETRTPLPARQMCVLAADGPVDALAHTIRRWSPDALLVRSGDRSLWALVPPDHDRSDRLTERLLATAPDCTAMLTEPIAVDTLGPARLRTQRATARLAPGSVQTPTSLAAADVPTKVDDFLASAGRELIEALVGFLRHRGQWEQASRALGLHRNTLRYRVTRARTLLDLDLDDPDVAAETWLTLRSRGVA